VLLFSMPGLAAGVRPVELYNTTFNIRWQAGLHVGADAALQNVASYRCRANAPLRAVPL